MSEPVYNEIATQLEWEQVKSTINLLTLAVSQIECTMSDGEKSVAELTKSFSFIAEKITKFTTITEDNFNLEEFRSEGSELHSHLGQHRG